MEKIALLETPLIAVSFFFTPANSIFFFTFVISVLINVRRKFPVSFELNQSLIDYVVLKEAFDIRKLVNDENLYQ